jgi:hypothetical protein
MLKIKNQNPSKKSPQIPISPKPLKYSKPTSSKL